MQSTAPTHPSQESPARQPAAPPPAHRPAQGGLWDFAEACLQQTAAILHEARAATDAEIRRAMDTTRESHASGKPLDLLEALARVQGHDEEHIGRALLDLSNKISFAVTPYPPVLPFGGKLIAPSAFYDSFEQIHHLARVLLSPVIYAEDTDAIGTASINPVAASLLAGEIAASVFKRFGIRPFVTIARLDYESWTFLTRKHFEL